MYHLVSGVAPLILGWNIVYIRKNVSDVAGDLSEKIKCIEQELDSPVCVVYNTYSFSGVEYELNETSTDLSCEFQVCQNFAHNIETAQSALDLGQYM